MVTLVVFLFQDTELDLDLDLDLGKAGNSSFVNGVDEVEHEVSCDFAVSAGDVSFFTTAMTALGTGSG